MKKNGLATWAIWRDLEEGRSRRPKEITYLQLVDVLTLNPEAPIRVLTPQPTGQALMFGPVSCRYNSRVVASKLDWESAVNI
jgi:hypothetical protein